MRRKAVVYAGVLLGGLLHTASAAALSGTFDMSGVLTVTPSTISWTSDLSPFLSQTYSETGSTASFIGENGQNTVKNLNINTQPVGASFPAVQFIMFNVIPGLPDLNINFIYLGTGGTANCTAAPAVNQTCTLANPPFGSPFTFTNDPGGTSDAKFVFSGVTSDGLSTWNGIFTSQFNTPFQTVVAAFQPGGSGSVTHSYSATITVTPTPEPSTLMLFGAGVALLALGKMARR